MQSSQDESIGGSLTIKLYNTLTRKKEEFQPIREGKVGVYACGITVYDVCHVGHARSAVVFDTITRYFRYRGYEVTFVKNFTDVDDKIIRKSNEAGVDIADISERYIREHDEDMDRLGVVRPSFAPRATGYIQGMINLIQRLMEKGSPMRSMAMFIMPWTVSRVMENCLAGIWMR
jgi:cysteinyl-tRNA synthetase